MYVIKKKKNKKKNKKRNLYISFEANSFSAKQLSGALFGYAFWKVYLKPRIDAARRRAQERKSWPFR